MAKVERSSTAEAVLGILDLNGGMSGYEVRRFMEDSTANFWSESFGQIYPTLKKLLDDGLIRTEETDGAGHPAKKKYRVTDAGSARLQKWLKVPAKASVPRNEFLLKLFFGGLAKPAEMRPQVEAWKAVAENDLLRYEPMLKELQMKFGKGPERPIDYPPLPYWLMTVRYGIAEAKMTVKWCNETLAELKRLDDEYVKRGA